MRILLKSLVLLGAFAATVSIAADATEPAAKARQELMGTLGMNAKILGDMAGGKTAFDAAAAEAAKAAIVAAAAEIPARFEANTTDPKSKAKAEIWMNWDDFLAKANALSAAAGALDAATVEGVQAGMGAVGGVCAACHKAYRS